MNYQKDKSPRDKFRDVLYGKPNTDIPFIIWDNKVPSTHIERELLQKGACIVVKSQVYKTVLKNIKTESKTEMTASGKEVRHTIYRTPVKDLSEMTIISGGSAWREKKLFDSPDDYNAILSLIDDYEYIPCYDEFIKDDMKYENSGIARPATEKSPFFEIIYEIMGMMNFAVEWAENKDCVLKLYESLLNKRRERLKITADSPAEFVIVDGNIETSVISTDFFNSYYAPVITEACDLLKGKITGLHLDGNNIPLIAPVNALPIEIIESFTPPPDCEMTLIDAMAAWPEKRFIVNFPSSVHLQDKDKVINTALSLCAQAGDAGRVMVGICEDIPRTDHMTLLADTVGKYNA